MTVWQPGSAQLQEVEVDWSPEVSQLDVPGVLLSVRCASHLGSCVMNDL